MKLWKVELLVMLAIPFTAMAVTPKNELDTEKPVATDETKQTPKLDPEYDYHLQAIAAKADAMQQKIQAAVVAQMSAQSTDLLLEQKAVLQQIQAKYPEYDVAAGDGHFVLTPKAKK